jgi:YHS domain-containing protein
MAPRTSIFSRQWMLEAATGVLFSASLVATGGPTGSAYAGDPVYPSFGLPSSALGEATVTPRRFTATTSSRGQVWSHAPAALSSQQTEGARPLIPVSGLAALFGSKDAPPRTPPSAEIRGQSDVRRQMERLYQQNGQEMPRRDDVAYDSAPQPARPSDVPYNRSVLEMVQPRTPHTHSSARPAPMAHPQQSPPRRDAAIAQVSGRNSGGGLFRSLFNRPPRDQARVEGAPPAEPLPFQPPTYKSEQARRQQPRPTPAAPGTPATPAYRVPPAVAHTPAPAPLPPPQGATLPGLAAQQPAPQVPLLELKSQSAGPIAPPEDLVFFPDDIAQSTPPTPAPAASPETAAITPANTPVERPRNYAADLGMILQEDSTPPAEDSADASATAAAPSAADPQRTSVSSNLPKTSVSTSEEIQSRAAELLLLPQQEPVLAGQSETSPFSGLKLNEGGFEQPLAPPAPASPAPAAATPSDALAAESGSEPIAERDIPLPPESAVALAPRTLSEPPKLTSPTPADAIPSLPAIPAAEADADATEQDGWSQTSTDSALREPAPFFPNDEHAIDAEENLDIGVAPSDRQTFAPSGADIANADSHSAPGMESSTMQQIAAREGAGLKGFCPVSLRDDRSLRDGKAAYLSFYRGRPFYFASPQAKAAFDNDPSRYAPAGDGYDVALKTLTGELVEGTLDHGVWFKDRLYLFASAESLKTFMAAPNAMAVVE